MITSTSNDIVKQVVALNQKSKYRQKDECYVVEGMKMFLEAPNEAIKNVFISEKFKKERLNNESLHNENVQLITTLQEKLKQCNVTYVSEQVFTKMSDTKTPQGILCVLQQFRYKQEQMIKMANPLFLLLEDIQDPGNLGTILRSAEGAGVTGVFMTKNSVDIYNPKTIRATMGSIYRVPFCYINCMEDLIEQLQQNKVQVFAAHLKGTTYYDRKNYITGTAFLIGNEGNGLKEETASKADCYIKIPMGGELESLNAAIAATLLIYEANRQRRVIL